MKISKRAALGASALAAVAFAVPTLATPGSPAGGDGTIDCGDGTVTWDPSNLWPPSHKMQTINIGYTSGEDDATSDTSSITVDAITHDQFVTDQTTNTTEEQNGSGHTLVDFDGIGHSGTATEGQEATTTASVRGERSGRDQTGRTYTITVTCKDYNEATGIASDTEMVDLTVTVPHDQRAIKD
jgi:hypothetical protein